MIDEEILDKVCPIPDEDETMEEIKGKLGVDDVGKLNGVRGEKRRFALCAQFPA